MKKIFLPLGLLALIAAPSAGLAKLVLDIPPILAGKPPVPCEDDTGCTSGKKCCSGSCYSDVTNFCYNDKVYAKSNGFECGGTYYPTGVGYCCGDQHYATTDGFCCEEQHRTSGVCCDGDYYADACPAPSGPTNLLNDTGIVTPTGGGQDADFGRDKTHPDDTDGWKGFSFTSINSTCVLDNVTGLAWEVKTTANTGSTYNWTGAKSYAEGFTGCNGSTTYTCRLPTVKELLGIVHFGKAAAPFIDPTFFPNTASATHLSGTEVANASSSPSTQVWGVDFFLGNTDNAISKESDGYRVRAVCVPKP
uniref:Lcl C-terminal domain-containing protein n=1 Tax=Candidatus Electronema sp. TaxID=2698783 RepID=UPI004056DC31